MFRALLDLVIMAVVAIVARAIIGSLMKGFRNAAQTGFGQAGTAQEPPAQPRTSPRENVRTAGELHKDPVCGMYVSESTRFQRRGSRDTFYYCSEDCKGKHAVAAR